MDISLQDATIEKAAFPQGQIRFLARDADYGLIESKDGRDVYFHRRSVIGVDFTGLGIGDRVRFSETADRQKAQATTVFLAGRRPPAEW